MLKRRIGGKIMGRGWKGRAWRAVINVARRVGGSGESNLGVREGIKNVDEVDMEKYEGK